ncbi:hypothetical protein ABZ805_16530 [Saccharopolyspora sp. NPDC047091]|uniref:hypothetical protein n=1 Tax=Saccharopolyspora sp. NPDC047091 TaxID=3155924 RepID=UPI0033DAEE93
MNPDHEFSPFLPEIALVPLWTTAAGPVTGRGTPVDLESAELAVELVAELAGSTVRLAVPEDLEPAAFAALADLPVPDCFAFSGWLTEHRPLLLQDGIAVVDGWRFEHDPEHGLLVAPEESSN